jgi:hypothetical protein
MTQRTLSSQKGADIGTLIVINRCELWQSGTIAYARLINDTTEVMGTIVSRHVWHWNDGSVNNSRSHVIILIGGELWNAYEFNHLDRSMYRIIR